MITLDSSVIKACSYDFESQELMIYFPQGDIRVYKDVPERVFEGLINAKSSGSYFNIHIRESFEWVKL